MKKRVVIVSGERGQWRMEVEGGGWDLFPTKAAAIKAGRKYGRIVEIPTSMYKRMR